MRGPILVFVTAVSAREERAASEAVQVTVGIGVDPACVGYALDQLHELITGAFVDELRASISRDGARTLVEVTAVLGGRVVRVSAAADGPLVAVDHVHGVVADEAAAPVAG